MIHEWNEKVISCASLFSLPLTAEKLNSAAERMEKIFPTSLKLMQKAIAAWFDAPDINLHNPKQKRGNFVWDTALCFGIGADLAIGGAKILVVVDDKAITKAATETGCGDRGNENLRLPQKCSSANAMTAPHRLESRPVEKGTGVRSDQIVWLTLRRSLERYPDRLRRVSYHAPETNKALVFLTNNFDLPPLVIAQLFCTYVLVAIVRKELGLELSLSQILQVLSVNAFKQAPLAELVAKTALQNQPTRLHNKLEFNIF